LNSPSAHWEQRFDKQSRNRGEHLPLRKHEQSYVSALWNEKVKYQITNNMKKQQSTGKLKVTTPSSPKMEEINYVHTWTPVTPLSTEAELRKEMIGKIMERSASGVGVVFSVEGIINQADKLTNYILTGEK
jgi:hypothetical protein